MTSGHLVINRQSGDLTALVADVVDRARPSAAERGTDIGLQADSEVSGFWDLVLLETVVTNLISNAAKFGAGKPVAVTVAMLGSMALLTVADQGIGIETAAQRRIFERFERADPGDNYGGFGLGLGLPDSS